MNFFGDSFTGMFTILKDKRNKIYTFKGATAFGLSKVDNKNRKRILKKTGKNNVFYFGNVDLNFSFNYEIMAKGNYQIIENPEIFIDKITRGYSSFLRKIRGRNFVILPTFSTISDKMMGEFLINYGTVDRKTIEDFPSSIKKIIFNRKFRNGLVTLFNDRIQELLPSNFSFIDINEEISTKNGIVKKKFKNKYVNTDHHLVWETTLPLIIEKFKEFGIDLGEFTTEKLEEWEELQKEQIKEY